MITIRFPVGVVERLGTPLPIWPGWWRQHHRPSRSTHQRGPQDKVRLGLDFRSLRLFDHETERALL